MIFWPDPQSSVQQKIHHEVRTGERTLICYPSAHPAQLVLPICNSQRGEKEVKWLTCSLRNLPIQNNGKTWLF